MSTHILQARPSHAAPAPASTLAPPRAFAAPANGGSLGAGHELGRVTVSAPANFAAASASAPIQRVPPAPKPKAPKAHHHDPAKKKHLPSGLGKQQNAVSAQQFQLIQQGVSRKDAKRAAKAIVKKNK